MVHSVYRQSLKNQQELSFYASEVSEQINKVRKILSVCWVASSFRALLIVGENYAVLHGHFTFASEDQSFNANTHETFWGFAMSLASEEFVLNLESDGFSRGGN